MKDDVDLPMRKMQVYLVCIPYVEGFKKKLAEGFPILGAELIKYGSKTANFEFKSQYLGYEMSRKGNFRL